MTQEKLEHEILNVLKELVKSDKHKEKTVSDMYVAGAKAMIMTLVYEYSEWMYGEGLRDGSDKEES